MAVSTEVPLNWMESSFPPPWTLFAACILLGTIRFDPNKDLRDVDSEMHLVKQVRVKEKAFDPFLSIVIIRVEVHGANECILSCKHARECNFVSGVKTERRVKVEVTVGDLVCHVGVPETFKVGSIRHLDIPLFERSTKPLVGPEGKQASQTYGKRFR